MKLPPQASLKSVLGALCLLCAVAVQNAKANLYLDNNGTAAGFGITNGASINWDTAVWTTDSTGVAAPTTYPTGAGNFPRFTPAASASYSITLSGDEHVAGLFQTVSTATLTINSTGSGFLDVDAGDQGFLLSGTVVINAPIGGSGAVAPENNSSGVLKLNAVNTYSGGTAFGYSGNPLVYFNNSSSFGTGSIRIVSGAGGNLYWGLLGQGGAAITLPNLFDITANSGSGFNFAADANTPVTCTGNWNLGNNTVLIRTSGGPSSPLTLSGVINGVGGVVFTANSTSSTLVNGANTYGNGTALSSGGTGVAVALGNVSALGYGPVTVNSGSTLELSGQSIGNSLVLNGAGTNSIGALVNNSSTPVTLNSGALGSITVTAAGSGYSTAPTVTISGGGGSGATATALLGVTAASFTINSGTQKYSVAPNVTINGGSGGATATATLASGLVTAITVTAPGAGFITAPTISFSGGTISTSGTVPSGTGNATHFCVGAVAITAPGSGYTSAPTVTFGSGAATATAAISAVTLASNSSIGGAGSITINDVISGSGTLTKAGAGTLTLTAPTTRSGGTTLNAGLLSLASASALGAGTFTVGGNGSFDNTTPGDLTVANAFTLSGGSPVYVGSAHNMTINGAVTLSGANRTITVSANTLTLGSAVGQDASARGLTKAGAGTLVLQGVNTYSGNTAISGSGGTLMIAGSGQLGSGTYAGTLSIGTGGTFNYASSAAQTMSGVISSSGGLTVSGSGTLTLTAVETYTGATTLSAGTLALSGSGSLANGTSVSIAAGATLDVSARTSTTYTLGTSATLSASGTGTTVGSTAATIVGAAGGTVSLGSRPVVLTYTPASFNGDATHPALYITQGTLSLSGNGFTVNNASGTALDAGTYVLVEQASGNITSAGACPVTVTGSGVVAGNTPYIVVNGGTVNLMVAPTAAFSALSSATATYGATSVTLSGTVSAAGPIYPALGEAVTVTINGNAQTTTIADATGDFSISYNPASLLASATPYAITYAYAGNGALSPAVDASTTLTVNKATLSVTGSGLLTYGNDPTNAFYTAAYSGFLNGDTDSVVTGTANYSTDATATNYIGTNYVAHVVDVGTLAAANYTFTAGPDGVTTITNRPLWVTNALASDKVYDATTAVVVDLSGAGLTNLVNGDDASVSLITSNAVSAFSDKDAGPGKTVDISGLAIVGDLGTNYVLIQPTTTTANITAAPLAVSATGIDKTYDGTTVASVTLAATPLGTDSVTPTYTLAAFADKNVAAGIGISVSGIALTGADAGNYTPNATASTTASITARSLTVTATGVDKVYDGDTAATVTLADNKVAGDAVTEAYTSAAFADKAVGTGKAVSVSGISLSGDAAGNYTLANPTANTTANITARSLTVTATAANKAYDGTTTASVTLADDRVAGDAFTDSYTSATFADKTIGTGKTVTVSGISISGADAGNYALGNTTATATADITGVSLTVAGAQAADRVYDGTTNATLILSNAVLVGVAGTDDVTLITTNAVGAFADKNVGANKLVTLSGLGLAGPDAANYGLIQPTTNASITPAALTVTATAGNKVYDGTTAATVTLSDDKVAGEDVSESYTSAAFADPNVATGITVNVGGIALSGADIGNYTLASTTASTTADITARTLTVTATGVNKVYDGTPAATVTLTDDKLSGDDVSESYASAAFADPNVGTAKAVSVSGISLSGMAAGNYTLASATASTTADITPLGSMTVLTSSLNPSTEGSNVTFTATVSSAAGTPTGEVVFLANNVPFSTNTLAAGVATADTTALPVGTNVVVAQYATQDNWLLSSSTLQQVVQSAVVYSQTNAVAGITANGDGTYTLSLVGTPGATYYVVSTADVTVPVATWSVLSYSTNTAPSPSGQWSVVVSNAAPAFYRSVAVNPAP